MWNTNHSLYILNENRRVYRNTNERHLIYICKIASPEFSC
jgi:hypothetical protein